MVRDASRCSSGSLVDVYWVGSLDVQYQSDHVDAVVGALMELVRKPADRVWDPYLEIMTEREFRNRVVAATEGRLVPVDHVKPIMSPDAAKANIYEVRWTGITVVRRTGRKQSHSTIEVRLLHAEPAARSHGAVAVHVHEKRTDRFEKIKLWQDAEISRAVATYETTVVPWLSASPDRRLNR